MRTLIYKRTHDDDPENGVFGVYDCMRSVRSWEFDAVIGVGGVGEEPVRHGINGKLNWIGIGAHRKSRPGLHGPLITFDHFVHYGKKGKQLAEIAPYLADHIYGNNVRVLLDRFSAHEMREVDRILVLAKNAPPSPDSPESKRSKACRR
jgi:hypothetical protein